MVWEAISYNEMLELVEIDGTMDAKYYCDVLHTYPLSNQVGILEEDWIYQQDNASVHTDKATMKWLQANNVDANTILNHSIGTFDKILHGAETYNWQPYLCMPNLVLSFFVEWFENAKFVTLLIISSFRCALSLRE